MEFGPSLACRLDYATFEAGAIEGRQIIFRNYFKLHR